ncbi:hypothetical protein HHX48_17565 [Salinimonas sp. HHU 13199]|uniref:Uncharacterized protein n=1 Tax=Salinimonas profundi TaxID=2729140 RepID=A0ABR8LQH2_9ALTE|nr:hypothetical protein [Salinimonas profundi]MBD3587550.1 hypothetical protein [Salinimonas profundi]
MMHRAFNSDIAEQVKHHAQLEFNFLRRDFCDVSEAFGFRQLFGKVASEVVR